MTITVLFMVIDYVSIAVPTFQFLCEQSQDAAPSLLGSRPTPDHKVSYRLPEAGTGQGWRLPYFRILLINTAITTLLLR